MTTPLAGPATLPGSADSAPTELDALHAGLKLVKSEDGRDVLSPDKALLQSLGISKRTAMRILVNGKTPDFLNTRVTARVLIVNQANCVEEIMRAQKRANRMGRDPNVEPRVRCACLATVAQCGMALARISEVALATARNLDVPEDGGEKPKVTNIQQNIYGFPPVAEPVEESNDASAKSGELPAAAEKSS